MLDPNFNKALVNAPQSIFSTILTSRADLLKTWVEENLDLYKVRMTPSPNEARY